MPPCLTLDREFLMSWNLEKILSVISTSEEHYDYFADDRIYFIRKHMENDVIVKYEATVVPRDQP